MSRLALVALAALLLLPGLGRMGAMDSTDARYLAIAREMARDGDWLVPRLAGAPHLDKPPLAYWASALGATLFGDGEAGGRALQQVALGATALVVASATRIATPPWSLAAALALLTAALPFGLSRGLATDLFQLAFTTPALLLLHDAAERRSARRAAAAFALLGASMLAKGPIALLVVAAVWGGARLLGARARPPLRGVAIGLALFAAIGLPWYALVAARMPGLLDWFASQLAGRVTGDGVGHVKDATYLARSWLLGLLPWTPLVLLAIVRLWPRGPRRDADATDAFLIAWALAPVALFSLFETKLASYVAPALPGALLVVARAGTRGLLDDRAARIALGAAAVTTALAAALLGAAILAESAFGRDAIPRLALHGDSAAHVFGLALIAAAVVVPIALQRVLRLGAARAWLATALASGFVLACAFHAIAPALPTLRDGVRAIAGVPGARVVSFTFQPSLFYYAEPAASVYVAGVRGLVEPFVDPASAARLTLDRAEGLAMLREDAPTFALVDAWQADDLAALADTRLLRRAGKYAIVANPAALRALAERGIEP